MFIYKIHGRQVIFIIGVFLKKHLKAKKHGFRSHIGRKNSHGLSHTEDTKENLFQKVI